MADDYDDHHHPRCHRCGRFMKGVVGPLSADDYIDVCTNPACREPKESHDG